jgi:diaminohydroxyphosphoribosylaminopyrimidine deaminase/5-amino-6-(5-phosphoribosylamino)uracil reductase
MTDDQWIARALELAERGRGHVEPNPLVGAIVVREGKNVGEGWHQRFGGAHAEVVALSAAGTLARGATLYVTLEPCCHHGKTPPCTDALLHAGITRVVAAMLDPFPEVAGRGAERLRSAGVDVDMGIAETAARTLNAPYLKLLGTGRPYVHAKWAMTLDGKIATSTGDSQWISNESSRRLVHELRGRMDAIIVGIGTALKDDPLLTARPPGPRAAMRVVLDSHGRLPPTSQLARTAREVATLVVAGKGTPSSSRAAVRDLGCEILELSGGARGLSVTSLLDELGRRRFTNLLVEGGSTVLGSFLDAGEIDEVHVFLAPLLIGGATATSAVAGRGAEKIAEGLRLARWEVRSVDGDVYLHGRK